MAHTYLLFDFGTDEAKAQLARHKLEGWKQAFRLDKKLLYKLDRGESAAAETADASAAAADPAAKSPKSSAKSGKSEKSSAKSKSKSKEPAGASEKPDAAALSNGKVSLLVRLYFSGHEKLTEQRWLSRIPAEEPFKDASPRVVHEGEGEFDDVVQQFDSLQ